MGMNQVGLELSEMSQGGDCAGNEVSRHLERAALVRTPTNTPSPVNINLCGDFVRGRSVETNRLSADLMPAICQGFCDFRRRAAASASHRSPFVTERYNSQGFFHEAGVNR